jgi:hypothetical protein
MRVNRAEHSTFVSGFCVASRQPGADAHSFFPNSAFGATDCNADAQHAADGNAERVVLAVAVDYLCASPATVAGSARRRCS